MVLILQNFPLISNVGHFPLGSQNSNFFTSNSSTLSINSSFTQYPFWTYNIWIRSSYIVVYESTFYFLIREIGLQVIEPQSWPNLLLFPTIPHKKEIDEDTKIFGDKVQRLKACIGLVGFTLEPFPRETTFSLPADQ